MAVITRSRSVPRRLRGFAEDDAEVINGDEVVDAPTCSQTSAPGSMMDPGIVDPSQISVDPSVTGLSTDYVAKGTATLAMLSLPFFAYLTFTPRLPGWARAAAMLLGTGVLFAEGGLIQSWSAKDSNDQPLFQGFGHIDITRGRDIP